MGIIILTNGPAQSATTFAVALSAASAVAGSSVTMTITPGVGGWPSGTVVTALNGGLAGAFDAATRPGAGTTPVVFVFTTTAGSGPALLNASAPNMTSTGGRTYTALPPAGPIGNANRFELVMDQSSVAPGGAATGNAYPNGPWTPGNIILTPSIGSAITLAIPSSGAAPIPFSFTPSAAAEIDLVATNSAGLYNPLPARLTVFAGSSGTARSLAVASQRGDHAGYQFSRLGVRPRGFGFGNGFGPVWLNVTAIGGATDGLWVRLYDAASGNAMVGSGTELTSGAVQVHGPISAAGMVRVMLPVWTSEFYVDVATDATFSAPTRVAQRLCVSLVVGLGTRSQETGYARSYASTGMAINVTYTKAAALVGYDPRYGNSYGNWFVHDGVSTDPDTNHDGADSSAALMEFGRLVEAKLGCLTRITGLAASGGGIDQFLTHDGSLVGSFDSTVAYSVQREFRLLITSLGGWDGVDSNFPAQYPTEGQARLQAMPAKVAVAYPSCAAIMMNTGNSGWYGPNASQQYGEGRDEIALRTQVAAVNPMVVVHADMQWNEFHSGHATQGARKLFARSGLQYFLDAELSIMGGTPSATHGPTLGASGTYDPTAHTITIPYTLHGGTALVPVGMSFNTPAVTVNTASPAECAAQFGVYVGSGYWGNGTPVEVSSATISESNIVLQLVVTSGALVNGLTSTNPYTYGQGTQALPSDGRFTVHYGDFGASSAVLYPQYAGGPARSAALCDNTDFLGVGYGRAMLRKLDIAVAPLASTGPLTGISYFQASPTNSSINEGAINEKPVVATFAPVGGQGPFVFECLNTDGTMDANGYTAVSYRNSIRGLAYDRTIQKSDMGLIVVPGNASVSGSRLLRITDATGTVVTLMQNIDTSLSTKQLWISSAARTVFTDQNPYTVVWQILAWNGTALEPTTGVSIKSDSSGLLNFNAPYGILGVTYVSQWPPAIGTYTVVLQASGYADLTLTFQVKAGAISDPVIVPTAGLTLNTAMPPYTPFAKLGLTTALNNAAPVIFSDPAIAYNLYTNELVLRAPPTSPGTLTPNLALSELDPGGNAAATVSKISSLAFNIAQGTAISSSAMNLAGLVTTFNNDTYLNVLGNIPVPAGIDASKAMWRIVAQTGYTRRAELNLYGASPARYQIARNSDGSGRLTAPAMLSAGLDGTSAAQDTLLLSCTDGLAVCTESLMVTVNWAPISRTIYVGQGMASAHGANGYEKWWDYYNANFTTYAGTANPSAGHAGTWKVFVQANADPDWHAVPVGSDRFPMQGPLYVQGVPDSSGNLPRLGGAIANNSPTDPNNVTKSVVRFGDGDSYFTKCEVSCVHGSNQGDQRGGVYKDGTTYGNLSVVQCVIRDVANGILAGHIHGAVLIDQTEISHSGTETGGAGPAHGIYLDDASAVTITNNYFRLGNYGHLLKSRGTNQYIAHNRIIAGLGGSNTTCIDIPDGGVVEIAFNDIEHGPNCQGPNVIQWALEALAYSPDSPYDLNSLYVHDNRINGLLQAGQHFGGPSNMLKHARFLNRFGEPVQFVRFENNACWIAPNPTNRTDSGQLVITDTTWTTTGPAVSLVGNTTPALPFVTSTARPYLAGAMPPLGGLEWHFSYNDNFPFYENVWMYGDRDQISSSAASATSSTILATLHASNNLGDQGLGTPNPFDANTTWAIVTTPMYDTSSNPSPWPAAGKYQVVKQGDGGAQLQPTGTLTSGVDFILVQALASNGTKAQFRFVNIVGA